MLAVTEARRLGRKTSILYPTLSNYSESDAGAPTLSRCIGCLTGKFSFEALRIFFIDPDSPVMLDFRHLASHSDGNISDWKPDGGDWDAESALQHYDARSVVSDDAASRAESYEGDGKGGEKENSKAKENKQNNQSKLFLMNMAGYKRTFRFKREGDGDVEEGSSVNSSGCKVLTETIIEVHKIEEDSENVFSLSRTYHPRYEGLTYKVQVTLTLTQPNLHHISIEAFSKVVGPKGGTMATDSVIYQVQQEVEVSLPTALGAN